MRTGAKREFLERYDIVQSENYDRHRLGITSKAEIRTKRTVKTTAIQRLTMDKYATIRIEAPGSLYIISVYD